LDSQPPRRSLDAHVGVAQSAGYPPTALVVMRGIGWLVITPTSAGHAVG